MPEDLKKLMFAYSLRGMSDWRDANASLKRTAMRCLCNGIAEQPHDVHLTVHGWDTHPQFVPMPRHESGDFEWCFFLPKKAHGQLESLLLFILVNRKDDNCIAFRFECSDEGRHAYSHVQLTSKLSKSGLSAMYDVDVQNTQSGFLPLWLPDSYPAFPVPARDWTEMFLAMMTAVHGRHGGVDDVIRDLFEAGSGAHARLYHEKLQEMLCNLS